MGSSASKPSSSSISHFAPKSNRHCESQVPKAFSFPSPLVHHRPVRKGDTHHLVSLTSTTYGYIVLDDRVSNLDGEDSSDQIKSTPHFAVAGKKNLHSSDSMSPDSVINAWELMDGLDDDFGFDNDPGKNDPDKKIDFLSKSISIHDLGDNRCGRKLDDSYESARTEKDSNEKGWVPSPKNTKQPLWKHLSEESLLSDLDPNVVSSYRRALFSKQLGSTNGQNKHRNTKSLSSNPLDSSCSTGRPISLSSSPFLTRKPKSLSSSSVDSSYSIIKPKTFLRIEDDLKEEDLVPSTKNTKQPLWKHLSEESLLSDLDPNVVSSYKRALSSKQLAKNKHRNAKSLSLSPLNSSFAITKPKSLSSSRTSPLDSSFSMGKPESLSSVSPEFSFSVNKPKSLSPSPFNSQSLAIKPRLPGTEDKIIIYFTSFRGIRKTYEDCCSVRTIFRSFKVAIDERDVSMDSTYRKELQNSHAAENKPIALPQVFIRGNPIGGADEIKQLNDRGELAQILKDFPVCDSASTCESCGDARFMPCMNCGGSRKVFDEEEDGFKRCPSCNENGLLRCPECCCT